MPAPKGHEPYSGCETGGRTLKFTKEVIEGYADDFAKWLNDPTHIWLKDFALDNGFNPDYLSVWAEENEKFFGVYKQAKHRQESRLVNGGLQNSLNAGIVKFVLANHHGYSERSEQRVSGDAANPLNFILQGIDGSSKDLISEEQHEQD